MTDLTRDQVVEWLRLAEAATEGPWQQSHFVDRGQYRAVSEDMKQEWRRTEAITVRGPGKVGTPGCNRVGTAVTPEDRAFVILARTAVPALCHALLKVWNYEAEAMAAKALLKEWEVISGAATTQADKDAALYYVAARCENENAEGRE